MRNASSKVMSLKEAVSRYVFDGCHACFGGFTINRNPMAGVYEIIRQRVKDMHVYAHSNGQAVDELVGAGCVSKLEIAYGGSGRFAPTCIRFKKAVSNGSITVEDYSNFHMTLRFTAGAMGVPFLPTRSALDTDIIHKWGFGEALRKNNPRLPDRKLCVMDNPFGNWSETPKVVLVPAIQTDVALVHVQEAEPEGIIRINGLPFADIEQMKSARHVIVTTEKIAENGALRGLPDLNRIPPFCVDAVVHVPHGAYPTACYGCYDYDPVYLKQYAAAAADDDDFRRYLKTYIYDQPDHAALINTVGPDRIAAIKADPRTGYAVALDRR